MTDIIDKENIFSEEEVKEQFDISSEIGVTLIGPDAIRLSIVEEITVETLNRIKKKFPGVEWAGSVIIPPMTNEEVENLYPDLEENFLNAFKKVFGENETVLVVYEETNPDEEIDFFDELRQIKGKVQPGKTSDSPFGWGTSIRAAVPLPGDNRQQYESLSKKVEEGNLSEKDYIDLTNHLIHNPDSEKELAGLLLLIRQKDAEEIFGSERADKYLNWSKEIVKKK